MTVRPTDIYYCTPTKIGRICIICKEYAIKGAFHCENIRIFLLFSVFLTTFANQFLKL